MTPPGGGANLKLHNPPLPNGFLSVVLDSFKFDEELGAGGGDVK